MTDRSRRNGGVRSIERAFGVLEAILRDGGSMGVSRLSTEVGLPPPTVHRLVRTLVGLGYLRQQSSREYALGPKVLLFGESVASTLSALARPHLAALADELGETANLAMLDGNEIVYVAQVPSHHSMRMFTEVGRLVLPHCTAVGKALLADLPEEQVRSILAANGMPRHSPHTLTKPAQFVGEIAETAERGYALDDGEQEVGVRCVAVAVPGSQPRLAVSISGPVQRITEHIVEQAGPRLRAAAAAIADDVTAAHRRQPSEAAAAPRQPAH